LFSLVGNSIEGLVKQHRKGRQGRRYLTCTCRS